MLKFEGFLGINNVAPAHRLKGSDLLDAVNVDIGDTGEITRRGGVQLVAQQCHKNLHQAAGFLLATCGAALVAIYEDGTRREVHPSVGPERVYYCDLPDGRVAVSNGLVHGITDGMVWQDRSVPVPESSGALDAIEGHLSLGQYRCYLSHVRLTDGLESPAWDAGSVHITGGGFRLDGVPMREGCATHIYLSSHDGSGAYLAGVATGRTFEFSDNNAALVLPCRTLDAVPPVVGTWTAFWRGRLLVAQGSTLWASRPNAPHLADWRDFKQFSGDITAVQAVTDGIYVGTTAGLVFLAGTSWEQLAYVPTAHGPVVPGSGVSAPGHKIKLGDGRGTGPAMICIAGGEVVAGFGGGQTYSLTAERFKTSPAQVAAVFREVGGVHQYLAVPQ